MKVFSCASEFFIRLVLFYLSLYCSNMMIMIMFVGTLFFVLFLLLLLLVMLVLLLRLFIFLLFRFKLIIACVLNVVR